MYGGCSPIRRQDPRRPRRKRTDLCVSEHPNQVRNATSEMVGCAPVRGGLHLGQRPHIAVGGRPSVLRSGERSSEAGVGVRYRQCAGSMTGSSVQSAALHIRCGHSACPKAPRRRKRNLICSKATLVRVKPYDEILKTLDFNYRNRGLYFDPEMVPFTERKYEVDRPGDADHR